MQTALALTHTEYLAHLDEQATDRHVGAKLREFRLARNWTQTDLAKAVGKSFQQIQKYEKGSNRIGASRLHQFCMLLGRKPGDFFEGLGTSDVEPLLSSAALRLAHHFDRIPAERVRTSIYKLTAAAADANETDQIDAEAGQ